MNLLNALTQIHAPASLVEEAERIMAQVMSQAQQLSCNEQQLHMQALKIQKLTHELARYKRLQFGSKAETFDAEQRQLFEDDAAQDIAAVETELAAEVPAETTSPSRPRKKRPALPAHLERTDVIHDLASCTCDQCDGQLVKIGEDVTEQLDVEPARFSVIRHVYPQYACRQCETLSAEPAIPSVIDSWLASPSVLAWIVVSKYLDHLPLYRLESMAERNGVPLPRSTMSEWIGRLGVSLQPLYDRLVERLKQQSSLHADETPVQQLDPRKGKTKRAYLWAYRSNDLAGAAPIVVFDYQTSRSGQHAAAFLTDWKGTLMVDDYAGYKALFRDGVAEQACWAHARRKFYDLHKDLNHPVAAEALTRISRLYAIEAEGRELTIEERHRLRQQRSQPELEALLKWLADLTAGPGTGLYRAVEYVRRRETAFSRYTESGDLPIDNNPVENAIRPVALGKKNWLFAGSERAGRRAAVLQTLLGTARLNGLEPMAWLKDVLEKLPTWRYSRLDELLPLRPLER